MKGTSSNNDDHSKNNNEQPLYLSNDDIAVSIKDIDNAKSLTLKRAKALEKAYRSQFEDKV